MKRISGLLREISRGVKKFSIDGRRPAEEFAACREELLRQRAELDTVLEERVLPELAEAGLPIARYSELDDARKQYLREYFQRSVQPILTPLAVDSEHPFPFISNLGLNLAVLFRNGDGKSEHFVRIKVPGNRPRWVPLPDQGGFVPLEQVIAENLDLLYPEFPPRAVYLFRVTRGADADDAAAEHTDEPDREPGSIIRQVSNELKARRFAGPVRLQLYAATRKKFTK